MREKQVGQFYLFASRQQTSYIGPARRSTSRQIVENRRIITNLIKIIMFHRFSVKDRLEQTQASG
jgi:hypothetical protein